MVVYNVHSQCAFYKYKTYLCSKATVILIVISVLTVLFPLIFTYKSHGFWLRTDTYQEKPHVSFKYDFILIVDTDKQDIICSNLPHLVHISKSFNYCPLLKVIEDDVNRDGYNDILHFTSQVDVPGEQAVHGVTLLLIFDYKLSNFCKVQMEVVGVLQHSSALAGAGVSVVADLSLVQRHSLNPRLYDTRYNTSVVPQKSAFSLSDVLMQYSLRNISVHLTNVYTTWKTKRPANEPFTVEATILYTEATVRYTPSFWQVLKFGWVQFFPVLVISVLVFRKIKGFIFSNQLVYTYKEEPWKKTY